MTGLEISSSYTVVGNRDPDIVVGRGPQRHVVHGIGVGLAITQRIGERPVNHLGVADEITIHANWVSLNTGTGP